MKAEFPRFGTENRPPVGLEGSWRRMRSKGTSRKIHLHNFILSTTSKYLTEDVRPMDLWE